MDDSFHERFHEEFPEDSHQGAAVYGSGRAGRVRTAGPTGIRPDGPRDGHRPNSRGGHRRWRALAALAAVLAPNAVLGLATAPPAAAETTQCTSFPAKNYPGKPWSLQRVLLNQLWEDTKGETDAGKAVKVAVIDTGVDTKNKQLHDAVDASDGENLLPKKKGKKRGKSNGTSDSVGHGTKVAGLIAARPKKGTGFVGLAPESQIIPITQNDAKGSGKASDMATGIRHAVGAGAKVINISQDTEKALQNGSSLQSAVQYALDHDVVVVASAGNDGLGGQVKKTYPASYPGVLAVAASDRNNERAAFSQSGQFVDVAAPGVDMISTVPGGGHCPDNGTSFSAPYVSGVAALIRAKHPDWSQQNVIAQIEQTAERSIGGHDRLVGWGVVDPVRALTEDDQRVTRPHAREGVSRGDQPKPAKLQLGETTQERNERIGTYAVVGGAVLVTVIAGGSVVYRDWKRRTGRVRRGAGPRRLGPSLGAEPGDRRPGGAPTHSRERTVGGRSWDG